LIVQDGGQYLVLCHGDQAITCPFSIFDKTTQFRVSFDTGSPLAFSHFHDVVALVFDVLYLVPRMLVQDGEIFPIDGVDAVIFFGHPTSMSVPDTSLEFVDSVGVSAKSSTGKCFIPINFSESLA
jgi:hypothetical protein